MPAGKKDLKVGLAIMALSLGVLAWMYSTRPRPPTPSDTARLLEKQLNAGAAASLPMNTQPTVPSSADVRPVGTFTDTMAQVDAAYQRLANASLDNWAAYDPGHHAVEDAATIATLLRSLWHAEYSAAPDKAGDIANRMLVSADAADALHKALTAKSHDTATPAFHALAATCTECHQRYRD